MSLFNIFDVAGSGMSAQSVRLNTTASNIANADSVSSSIDKTYRSRHPILRRRWRKRRASSKQPKVSLVKGIVESDKPY